MSAADDSSNLSINSTDVYEDELFTWLQYPVDDVFERNYCSDLFGGLLPPPNAVDVNPSLGSSSDMGIGSCTGSGSSRLPIKKNVGTKSFLRSSSSNAEDALALGAARAAGRSSQVGHDSFNRVRTSMQPQAISTITTPCSSLKAFDHKESRVLLKPKIQVPYASKPPQGRVESAGLHMAEGFSMEKTKHSISLACEKSRKSQETHSKQLPHTPQSRSSHTTEEDSNERACGKYASSRSSAARLIDNAKVKGAMTTSSHSWDAVKGKISCADQASEDPPSYSGGSQTSMSLSFREVTYGGKRKREDSELQSEDAYENIRNIKVPCKSSSRRNRISEVHNLSERNRRNRINEKLKALQDLIPNSSKTDKASVLDEAIEYMKTLQMQLQMVSMRSSMNMTPMMMPMTFPPTPIHMTPLHPIGLGVPIGHAGMGVGFGTDMGLSPRSCKAVPFQLGPAAMTQYGMPFQSGNTVALHDSSQAYTNAGLLPAHHLASMQKFQEPSEEHRHLRSVSSSQSYQCQQQEQGQHLGYPLLNHEHEQQDGSSH